jgi:hypothetical protein
MVLYTIVGGRLVHAIGTRAHNSLDTLNALVPFLIVSGSKGELEVRKVLDGGYRESFPGREDDMKRRTVWAIGVVAILFGVATLVSAAGLDDIVGTWTVYSKSKAKVSKLGSDASEGEGAIQFSDIGIFAYDDPAGYRYTGTFTLSPDGKTLTMNLDAAGRLEFEKMMKDWLVRAAEWEGLILSDIRFEYDAKGLFVGPVKISKKTKGPTKGKVSAKGTVSAIVQEPGEDPGRQSTKFSFTDTTQFLFKQTE